MIFVVLELAVRKGRGLLVRSLASPCQKLSPARRNGGPTGRAVVVSAFLVVACAVLLQNPSADCFSGSIRRNPGTPSRASDRFVAGSLQKPGARAHGEWDPDSRPQAPALGRPEAHSMSGTAFSVVLSCARRMWDRA